MPFPERRRVSNAVRAQLAFDQDYKCALCAKKLPVAYQVDHIVPLRSNAWEAQYPGDAKAATKAANALSNLQILCGDCHGRKTFFESSDAAAIPDVIGPRVVVPSNKPPWRLKRCQTRHRIDSIWAHASRTDQVTRFLLDPAVWLKIHQTTTQQELRRLHQKARQKGQLRIPFSVFELRVNHLFAQ